MNILDIPEEVSELAIEALSDHNDGWTKEGARRRLREIAEQSPEETRAFIDRVLGPVPK